MERKDAHVGLFVFGGITIFMLSVANIVHLPLSVSIFIEQMQTGFGYGSNVELGALVIWLCELVILPALICGAVFLILHTKRKTSPMYFATSAVLLSLLSVQYIITNVFLFV